ncbi:hypothetical protein F4678DRAFT_472869 [Xylaria arbuscula]|nr:hypothetical protein F4678DRAFT_472869 [Xylaria arbuscula]
MMDPPKKWQCSGPDARRKSLVPKNTSGGSDGTGDQKNSSVHKRGMFNFGLKELMDGILLKDGKSHVSYHEYAVFALPDGDPEGMTHSPSITSEGGDALHMFRKALKNGHGLDSAGNFTANPEGKCLLQGRVQQVITGRRTSPRKPGESGRASGGLDLTVDDFETLNLHPATAASLRRTTSEAIFWDAKREVFHLILSFSSNPQPPYDFLSMTYTLRTKTTTALVRHSFDGKRHCEDAVSEYERRLDSCRARWAHPLVLPVVLLQVQLLRTEEAVKANDEEVHLLEKGVRAITGTAEKADDETNKRDGTRDAKVLSIASTTSSFDSDYVPPKRICLVNKAQDVLESSVQLLHTLRWIERVVKLLIQVGDELDARVKDIKTETPVSGEPERSDGDDSHDLSFHWCEIRQYLDSILRLCTSLETDREMSELRCRAQKETIVSILAQEDKSLNTRMTIASMRDNSSMKVLAIITAIFLPAEVVGTIFGMPMFSSEKGTADPGNTSGALGDLLSNLTTPLFWIYWVITIPLTLLVLSIWRGWWVHQDRYFRRHLSKELSNERYWTIDGRPRDLETTFMQDFFSPFSASGVETINSKIRYKPKSGGDDGRSQCRRLGTSKPDDAFSQIASTQEEELGVVQRPRRIILSFRPEPWTSNLPI